MYPAPTPEGYTYQTSFKFGLNDQNMLNIRAESAADMGARCSEIEPFVPEIVSVSRALQTAVNTPQDPASQALASLQKVWPDTQQIQTTPQPQQQAQQTYGQPPGAPVCSHGPMKYQEGVGKNGSSYRAYFCPAPRGGANGIPQCQAKFL